MDYKEAAAAIGGAVTRAYHLTGERTNRVLVEARKFEDVAMAAADGFENKYHELFNRASKFIYVVKVLTENECLEALNELENGIHWLNEHQSESIDKEFYGNYMLGYSCDPYKNRIKFYRQAAGLTQQQFAEMFDIPIDTVKAWDCGRRKPDKLKEKLIIEKLTEGRNG